MNLSSRIQGSLLGVAIGDAMGMPVETWTHDKIRTLNEGRGIIGFLDPVLREHGISDTARLKAGDTTDDWQLTKVVARSLIRTRGGFSKEDCAREHVDELARSTFGWGKTTETEIGKIRDGKRDLSKWPDPPGPKLGLGNGVIMKVAPLALAWALKPTTKSRLWKDCLELGSITHFHFQASIAAFAVARIIARVALHPVGTQEEALLIVRDVQEYVHQLERAWPTRLETEPVSLRLDRIHEAASSAREVRERIGGGFSSTETGAFAIATFVRHPADFRAGVLEAVSAGGDTDTNASVVGALIGANVGLEGIPSEWARFSPGFTEALRLGQALQAACKD